MEPIAGGPAAAEVARVAETTANRVAGEQQQAANLMRSLDAALELADESFTTGFWGARAAGIEGSPAYDLRATITTAQAIIGFQALNEMRQSSPTGGALGNITPSELTFLQAVWGSLDPDQSYDMFVANVQEVRRITQDIIDGRMTVDENGQLMPRQSGADGGAPADGGGIPEGVDPALWPWMTEEERALWR